MTFIDAIQHLTLGYRVRRPGWAELPQCVIFMNQDRKLQWLPGNTASAHEIALCPANYDPSKSIDLGPEDINADDWEIVR